MRPASRPDLPAPLLPICPLPTSPPSSPPCRGSCTCRPIKRAHGNKEMTNPILVYLRVISLVAHEL